MQTKLHKKLFILVLFGEVIREIRKEKKLSQEELANKSGLHRTYIGMVERGEKNISLKNISKLSKGLELPIPEIFKRLK
jgi:transcriptional regulator with XRE-family HTH domain